MNLQDYLIEVKIGQNPEIEKLFNAGLEQVFNSSYVNKINNIMKKRINIKEKVFNEKDVVAFVQGNSIYINKPQFYAKSKKEQIKYLLHEFLHLLNNSKKFIFFNKFKELKQVSKELWKIVKEYTDNPGMFLTGKKVRASYLNNQEAMSYLMNDKIQWKYISAEGRKKFINILQSANIFNLEHPFWKKRLT